MKNLKKLTREDLKKVQGGNAPGFWCCCGSSGCSTGVFGDSNDLYCHDAGTALQRCPY